MPPRFTGLQWAILLSLVLFSFVSSVKGAAYDVTEYGAKGDGKRDYPPVKGAKGDGKTDDAPVEGGKSDGKTDDDPAEGGKGNGKTDDDSTEGGKGDGKTDDDPVEGGKGDGKTDDDPVKGGAYDVTKYGAKGDGKTDDAPAFLQAWKEVCSSKESNPVLLIPGSKTFLLSPIKFEGPCAAPSVTVSVLGNVVSSTQKSHWSSCVDEWISFSDIKNLAVQGSGVFDGNGGKWWAGQLSCGKRPSNLAFNGCTNLAVSGIKSKDSARNHISISKCQGAVISGITLTAPDQSPNTDGINLSGSTQITIKDSNIGTGDDCIAVNNQCSGIKVSKVTCGPGHGISIGSLGRDGEVAQVEDVTVQGCTFIGTTNGARIKTWKGGKGYARRITYSDITLKNVKNPIIIDQSYVDKNYKRLTGSDGSSLVISDVKFLNIKGTSQDEDAITLACNQGGCKGIEIRNVDITSTSGEPAKAICQNAQGTSTQIKPEVSCLSGSSTKKVRYYDQLRRPNIDEFFTLD